MDNLAPKECPFCDLEYLTKEFFHSTLLGIIFVNKDLKIIEWNDGAEKITGYTKEEALGKPCSILKITSQECTNVCQKQCRMKQVFKQKKPVDAFIFGLNLTCKNGTKVPIMATESPIYQNNEIVGGTIVFFETPKLEKVKEYFEDQAYKDGLTHLYNRAKFYKIIQREINLAKRYHIPLSILFIDIDDLKNHNDSYGHIEGDNVLKKLAEILQNNIRDTDYVFRFGGEEFVVLLPNTNSNQAKKMAEKLRRTFETMVFKPKNSKKAVHKTISIGIAKYEENISINELIEMADEAMYRAKKNGKNRIYIFKKLKE